jgi:hypothetical protein
VVDVAGKIADATSGAWLPLPIAVASLSLRAISLLARRPMRAWVAAASAAAIVSLLSSFDPWRNAFFSIWPLSIAEVWFSWTKPVPWLRLCAPSVAALIVFLVGYAISLSSLLTSQRFGDPTTRG